jgi:membrane fusion protein
LFIAVKSWTVNLFRNEVISSHTDRLTGNIAVAVPVPWQVIGYLIFGSVIAGICFLLFANYARVETVAGWIVPDAGISSVIPSRGGAISAVSVREGDFVATGQQLVAIRAEEDSARGPTAVQIETAIARQDASLNLQTTATQTAALAQLSQIAAQSAGMKAEIAQLRTQILLQRDLVASAHADLARAKSVADRGFISGRDLQVRQESLTTRQQGLAQLAQALAARQSALSAGELSAAQIAAQARAQTATINASRAQVAQQAASNSGSRAYVLRAPVAGQVTALTARVGQAVSPLSPLMSIIPAGSTLRAELAVPSAAIGFVKPGQDVRLAIDAFPYQRFGTISGKVLTTATTAISQSAPNGATVPVYLVTVTIPRARISAYGRNELLISGMTLTARIVTEKQSLLQWLFEPIFAVRNR